MVLKSVPIDQIIPYENNPRKNDGAVDAVKASIEQCGYVAPIIVDENMVVLAGHTRLKALKSVGVAQVEVIVREGLTEEQKKKYRILDNKTGEFAEWDFEKLEEEFADIDFDGFDFGFEIKEHEWFSSGDKGMARDGEEDYKKFLDKFEEKHTSDDCYTPDNIYQVVVDYVESKYGIDRKKFVRPFRPGGDYKKEKYNANCCVVDNPPFSILSEIVKYYEERDIKFFMFCSGLTNINLVNGKSCVIAVGNNITYENGADICTSFVTNLENDCVIRSESELYNAIYEKNRENEKNMKKQVRKLVFPYNVVTSAMVNKFSKYGSDFKLKRESAYIVRSLDSEGEKIDLFGSGFLISEKAAAEKAAAEKAAAEKAAAEIIMLSEREKEIVKNLL